MPITGKGPSVRPELKRTDTSTGGRLLIILSFVSVVLFTISVREAGRGPISTVQGVFQTVVSPVRYAGGLVFKPISSLGNVVANLTADQKTLSELQEENRFLTAKNAELEEAARSIERLEALLELKNANNLDATAARVVSGSTDTWADTIVIDKGANAGLAVGMPVTDTNAVIGQIIECTATNATVRLLSDENSGVSAMVQSSRAQGILRGSADGSLRLTLIRTDQTVGVGDTVITSGLGGAFPKGLLLGRVTSVEKTPGALYYQVAVEQLSSVESFEEVLVIKAIGQDQQASAEEIAEADAQESTGITSVDTQQQAEGEGDGEGEGERSDGSEASDESEATDEAALSEEEGGE